jgi:hypothetical protein
MADHPKPPPPADLLEPPFDELYDLYLRSLAHDRKTWAAQFADDPHAEERMAAILQPKSKERFREYLQECEARGSRRWAVNCLVLGPEFCDAHPDDPRIQMPPGEEAQEIREFAEGFARVFRAGGLGPAGGRGRR